MQSYRVCPECGDVLKYDHMDIDEGSIAWECPECGWTGLSEDTDVAEGW